MIVSVICALSLEFDSLLDTLKPAYRSYKDLWSIVTKFLCLLFDITGNDIFIGPLKGFYRTKRPTTTHSLEIQWDSTIGVTSTISSIRTFCLRSCMNCSKPLWSDVYSSKQRRLERFPVWIVDWKGSTKLNFSNETFDLGNCLNEAMPVVLQYTKALSGPGPWHATSDISISPLRP